ncbi:MAG: hypothetical protein R3359_09940 [Marinirhabdus sp.]|nr:hypothetical protein [Marinirhabdus sp.]
MKKLLVLMMLFTIISCAETRQEQTEPATESTELDIQAELAAIEETRNGFQLAIKEGRFGDLGTYATDDVKSLTPICGPWEDFKSQRANPTGAFHYDSLIMRPRETIIVSDSVAYDFGTSSTYYTNENGEPIELIATFLAVLKKDKADGVWKLHREVANTIDLE